MQGSAYPGDKGCSCETWNCNEGPVDVAVDASGCPIEQKYCKQLVGDTALAVAAGATFTLTLTLDNLVEARIRGLMMEATDPAAAIPGISALPNIEINQITLLQNQIVSGQVNGSRFATDTNGPNGHGFASFVRGAIGTAGGSLVIIGINRSAVALDINATADIDGIA
jgi:hypothetical protein